MMSYILIFVMISMVVFVELLFIFITERSIKLAHLSEAKVIHRVHQKMEYDKKKESSIKNKKCPKKKDNFFNHL